MVQLTSDCFAFGGKLTRIDEALQSILESLAIKPETEQISLNRALNRFLAEDVIALENVPADNNSAVDAKITWILESLLIRSTVFYYSNNTKECVNEIVQVVINHEIVFKS